MATACIVFVVIWCLDRNSPQGYYHVLKGSDEDGFTLLGKLASCNISPSKESKSVVSLPRNAYDFDRGGVAGCCSKRLF